ncbi:MAG: methionine adenosyltransferase [Candidatus Aenigmarchaeota archaeon]|nr:methionine adenosyltransferase [Candidatus Aenigmarchaeota archaeon]
MIVIEDLHSVPTSEQKVEVVERKGIGHPDTICDSLMNKVSVELSKYYLDKFGIILHHNIDKGLLVAGEAEQKFGGGKLTTPMLLVFGDRATYEFEGQLIPVTEIAVDSAKKWFKENFRFVNPENDVNYQVELKRGSAALRDIFFRKGELLGANDTSAAVGYAPLTEIEKIILSTEKFLNSKSFKKRFPESGEDIKIMGLRTNGEIHLTVAMPSVDRFVESENDYFRKKEKFIEEIKDFVAKKTDFKTFVFLNTLDAKGRGIDGCYLTVTGTCAEDADCGQVGRGNRVNGLIPLNRPVSNEAAAGKNPVSHVGKVYNLLSHKIANEIYENVSGIKEIYVWLLSQIGMPIDKPKIAAAQVIMNSGSVDDVRKEVNEVIQKEFSNIKQFCLDLAHGKYEIC